MSTSAQNPESGSNQTNAIHFGVEQYLKKYVHTALVVQVKECFPIKPGDEGDEKKGFVHVELAVQQIDNEEEVVETKTLYNLPYTRIQAGHCAFVVDPEPDDWGFAIFCERDISKWKRSLEINMPDTYRMFDQGDGIYIGGIKNKEPKIYVQLHPEKGIVIETDDKNLTVHVGGETSIHCEGDVKIQCDSDVEWKIDGDFTIDVDGDWKQTVGGDQTEKASNIYHN